MRIQKLLIATLTLASSLTAVNSAMAGYKDHKSKVDLDDLEIFDAGTKLVVKGKLECLKDKDLKIIVKACGDATASCRNPGGKIPHPFKKIEVYDEICVKGHTSISKHKIKWSKTDFKVVTGAADPTVHYAPDCPNSNWTEEIKDVAFTTALITVIQHDKPVLKVECDFTPATTDGKVPDAQVKQDCHVVY